MTEVVNVKTDKILIFARTKRGCDKLCESLERLRFEAYSIHGDKTQSKRDSIIYHYKKTKGGILVATDVASRGLDIKDIGYVINFDFPMTIEDYIHRIGRTGRAGASGISFTFFTSNDNSFSSQLLKILKKSKQNAPQELHNWSMDFNSKKSKGGYFGKFQKFSRYDPNIMRNGDFSNPFGNRGMGNSYGGGSQQNIGGGGFGGGGMRGGGNFGSSRNNNNYGGGGGGYGNMQNKTDGFQFSKGELFKGQNTMDQPNPHNKFMENNNRFGGGDAPIDSTKVKAKNPGLFAGSNPCNENGGQGNFVGGMNTNDGSNNMNQGQGQDYMGGDHSKKPQTAFTQSQSNGGYQGNSQQQGQMNNQQRRDNYANDNGYQGQNNNDYGQQQKFNNQGQGNNNYNGGNRGGNYQGGNRGGNYQGGRNGNNNDDVGNNFNKNQTNNDYNNNDDGDRFASDVEPRKFTNSKKPNANSGLFAGQDGSNGGQDMNQVPLNEIGTRGSNGF